MAMAPKILLVEDELDFQEVLAEILTIQGYEVICVNSLTEFNEWYKPSAFDLAILDRTLPDGDGLDILKRIRIETSVPVIMLTGISQTAERVRGLDADADHYLIKPVNMKELLAIVRRLMRRFEGNGDEKVDCWCLDIHAWNLKSPLGTETKLSHRESLLLQCFTGRRGAVVHRDHVVGAMGFNPLVYDMRRLETMVSRLRKKLETAGLEEFPLQTVYGTGYALHTELKLV